MLQIVYGLLGVFGLGITWYFNLQFFAQPGDPTMLDFAAGGYANPAAASLSSDILVVGVAASIWMVAEGRRLTMRHVWFYIVFGLIIAMACTYPLFLMMRERALRRHASA